MTAGARITSLENVKGETGPLVNLKTGLSATPGTISDSRLTLHKGETTEKEVQGRWDGALAPRGDFYKSC